ncbi:MAG TPA: DNA replication/repair protein RecF [Kofleriaceae bacterium]|nr:DNA replication/repair protein RecF [Kofleriaceae bacterium]
MTTSAWSCRCGSRESPLRILALVASGVRNLRPLQLEPRERFNVFSGDNGQGKTNLLEAIFAVAALRSFRTARLADLVAFGGERATLGARVVKHDLVRVYEVEIAHGSRKVALDGKAPRPLARYFGGFNVVVFTPEDLALPRGSPGDRRRFVDRSVFNLRADYLGVAQDYERVLRTRNTVLRQAGDGALDRRRTEDLLAVYDQQIAALGAQVIAARQAFVDVVGGELAAAFAAITRSDRVASVRYAVRAEARSEAEILAALREARVKDLATHATQVGPHRDDLAFELDGREAGAFASQGQLRAIMLAWKTAELAVLARAHGDSPILLLDDVSSELDPQRNEFLFEHLAKLAGQCFITTTHPDHVLLRQHRADYRIAAGEIHQ